MAQFSEQHTHMEKTNMEKQLREIRKQKKKGLKVPILRDGWYLQNNE